MIVQFLLLVVGIVNTVPLFAANDDINMTFPLENIRKPDGGLLTDLKDLSGYEDPDFDQFLNRITTTYQRDGQVDSVTRSIGGNAFEILDTAEDAYAAWDHLLRGAQHSVHISTFLIEDDLESEIGELNECHYHGQPSPAALKKNLLACRIWQVANRGVRVRIIVDSLGTVMAKSSGIVDALARHPQIDIINFNPALAYTGLRHLLWKDFGKWVWAYNRIHEKILVVDGRVAILGGRNIGRKYMKPVPHSPLPGWGKRVYGRKSDFKFHDTDMLLRGPVVAEVQKVFLRRWIEFSSWEETLSRAWGVGHSHKCLQNSYYKIPYYCKSDDGAFRDVHRVDQVLQNETLFPELADHGDGEVRLIYSNPRAPGQLLLDPFFQDKESWTDWFRQVARSLGFDFLGKIKRHVGMSLGERIYLTLIHLANEKIQLINPYFIPSDALLAALKEAVVERGVRVSILTNSRQSNDVPSIWWCSIESLRKTLAWGIEIFEWQSTTGMLHSKAAVFDDKIGVVGSLNLDSQSLNLNSEILALVKGGNIIDQLNATWELDVGTPGNVEQLTTDSLEAMIKDFTGGFPLSSGRKSLCKTFNPLL